MSPIVEVIVGCAFHIEEAQLKSVEEMVEVFEFLRLRHRRRGCDKNGVNRSHERIRECRELHRKVEFIGHWKLKLVKVKSIQSVVLQGSQCNPNPQHISLQSSVSSGFFGLKEATRVKK